MKLEKVIPLHKKGDIEEISNYLSVSLLSAVSQLNERAMYSRFIKPPMAWRSFYNQERYFYPVPLFNMSPHSAAALNPYLNRRCILPVMNKKGEVHVPDNYSKDVYNCWRFTLVVHWSSHDVLFWAINQLYDLGVKNIAAVKLEHFEGINGTTLKHLSLNDLRKLIPDFGEDLYCSLQYRLSLEARLCNNLTGAPAVQKVYIPLEVVHKPQSPFQLQESGIDFSNTTVVESWTQKSTNSWTPRDTLEWLVSQLIRLGVKDPAALQLEHFNTTSGRDLVCLSLAEFKHRLPWHGDQLYHQLQIKIQAESQFTELDFSAHHEEDLSVQDDDIEKKGEELSISNPKAEKLSSLKENVQPANVIKTSKPQEREKVGRVWEFIRNLLLDSRYQDVISWVDREAGMFRFENSAKAAKLWGDRKGNTLMNFKKFSRAIRYNYKMGYLSGVEKNRLIYKFGPKSHGWKLENTFSAENL